MMKIRLKQFVLEMTHPFSISRQTFRHKRTLIVELEQGGICGLGEASENPYYGISIEQMVEDLTSCKTELEAIDPQSPEHFWQEAFQKIGHNSFALSALDMAYYDLWSKQKGQKLYQSFGYSIDGLPLSNYTIGIDEIDTMVDKMKEQPWPIYKIKLGTDQDLDIIRTLRAESDSVFRIDANCAWSPEQTVQFSKELKSLGVEFLEQPIDPEDKEGCLYAYEHSALPLIADESCQKEGDLDFCQQAFHGINIKLVKCGGLTPARRMLDRADEMGLKKMVGCMTESTVGISAIAHLMPRLDYVDLDGAMLLKQDIATGIKIEKGKVHFSDKNGIGAELCAKEIKLYT